MELYTNQILAIGNVLKRKGSLTDENIENIMKNVHVGCGPITWGRATAEKQILTEIAQAGYEGVHSGPKGERTPAETLALYAKYGLKAAPGYLGAEF